MAAVTVRNLPDEIHRGLKARAAKNGKSTEAEIRSILEQAVMPEGRIKVGAELAAFGRKYGGLELTCVRDPRPTEPADFE